MIFHRKFKLAIRKNDIDFGTFTPNDEELKKILQEVEEIVKSGKLRNEKNEILNWIFFAYIK